MGQITSHHQKVISMNYSQNDNSKHKFNRVSKSSSTTHHKITCENYDKCVKDITHYISQNIQVKCKIKINGKDFTPNISIENDNIKGETDDNKCIFTIKCDKKENKLVIEGSPDCGFTSPVQQDSIDVTVTWHNENTMMCEADNIESPSNQVITNKQEFVIADDIAEQKFMNIDMKSTPELKLLENKSGGATTKLKKKKNSKKKNSKKKKSASKKNSKKKKSAKKKNSKKKK